VRQGVTAQGDEELRVVLAGYSPLLLAPASTAPPLQHHVNETVDLRTTRFALHFSTGGSAYKKNCNFSSKSILVTSCILAEMA